RSGDAPDPRRRRRDRRPHDEPRRTPRLRPDRGRRLADPPLHPLPALPLPAAGRSGRRRRDPDSRRAWDADDHLERRPARLGAPRPRRDLLEHRRQRPRRLDHPDARRRRPARGDPGGAAGSDRFAARPRLRLRDCFRAAGVPAALSALRLGHPIRSSLRKGRAMKIAIVGTGISGLVAAHRLHGKHRITVYEAAPRLGGHTNTVRVEDPRGERWIDTGFIVFNDRNYPSFEALLAELGVATQPSHMSFSVSDGRGFEYSGTPWGLFARPSHLLSP